MSAGDPFWEAVDAALDARRDPLEDARVQQLLAERPEQLAQLAALRSGLDRVTRAGRRRVLRRTLAAALVLAVAIPLGLRVTRPVAGVADEVAPITTADAETEPPAASGIHPLPLQVLAFRAEVTVDGPGGRRTRVSRGLDGHGATVHAQACSEGGGGPLFVATVSVALP